jgi:hypothetical protein
MLVRPNFLVVAAPVVVAMLSGLRRSEPSRLSRSTGERLFLCSLCAGTRPAIDRIKELIDI